MILQLIVLFLKLWHSVSITHIELIKHSSLERGQLLLSLSMLHAFHEKWWYLFLLAICFEMGLQINMTLRKWSRIAWFTKLCIASILQLYIYTHYVGYSFSSGWVIGQIMFSILIWCTILPSTHFGLEIETCIIIWLYWEVCLVTLILVERYALAFLTYILWLSSWCWFPSRAFSLPVCYHATCFIFCSWFQLWVAPSSLFCYRVTSFKHISNMMCGC